MAFLQLCYRVDTNIRYARSAETLHNAPDCLADQGIQSNRELTAQLDEETPHDLSGAGQCAQSAELRDVGESSTMLGVPSANILPKIMETPNQHMCTAGRREL